MMKFDWKFFIMLFVSIAVGSIPILIWQSDSTAKSLTFQLTSIAGLQVVDSDEMPNISVSIENKEVKNPYLSTLILTNDASKPILSKDFETPISINLTNEAKIEKVNLIGTEPKGIKVDIKTSNNTIVIKPLLINPDDILKFSVLTSNSYPSFEVNARIAGVSNVNFEDKQFLLPSKKIVAFDTINFILSGGLYFYFCIVFVRRKYHKISGFMIFLTITSIMFSSFKYRDDVFSYFSIENNLLNTYLSFTASGAIFALLLFFTFKIRGIPSSSPSRNTK